MSVYMLHVCEMCPTEHFCFHFVYSQGSCLLKDVYSSSIRTETKNVKAEALSEPCWSQPAKDQPVAAKTGSEGGLLSDIREVQCLICSLLHQMFIADPNIAKLVHFQVITKVCHLQIVKWLIRIKSNVL